mmetsp:Transcript_47300/g.110250  ORF Transcript_47300/g.110250 Transcript_47300/m.110250 type:complete len:103 (+) Transcript_47300:302-610(+)
MNVKSQQNARDYLFKVYEQEHANYFQDKEAMACIAECFSEFLNANIGVDLTRDKLWIAGKGLLDKFAGAGIGSFSETLAASAGDHVSTALTGLQRAFDAHRA